MEVDADGNERGQRTFTEQEEMEFLELSRKENFYDMFANSVAPQIYGHSGKHQVFTSNSNE